MDKLRMLIRTSRPLSWVNTAYPFAAGYLMMSGQVDARLIIGTIFFLIPYNLMMYGINDVFDYESDIRNPRKGGVEGAITPKRYHPLILWASLLSSVPFVGRLLLTGSVMSGLTLLVVLFFVVAYSLRGLRFKEIPLLDSITSSMHFVGPLLFAYSLVGTTTTGWLVAVAFFLWGMASQAFGAVQDIVPDREAGIHSIATYLGARQTVWGALVLYSGAAAILMTTGGMGLLVGLASLIYVVNIVPYARLQDGQSARARAGWRRFLWMNFLFGAVVTIACVAVKFG